MNFYRKVWLSIFLTSFVLGIALLTQFTIFARRSVREQFTERYAKLADVVANSLLDAEDAAERNGVNVARQLGTIVEAHGVPSEEALKKLARELQVSLLTVVDREGRFLRNTITPPEKRTSVLFDYCDDYRKLVTGETTLEVTPIVPSSPYEGPFKFVMLASRDRKYIFESGMMLGQIGQILAKTLRTDGNIRSLGLLSPTGFNFGTIFADGRFLDGGQQRVDGLQPGISAKGPSTLEVVRRVNVKGKQCCECKVKGVGGDGYHYLLRLEVDAKPLAALLSQANWTALVMGVVLFLVSGVVAHLLASRLVRRLRGIDAAVREVNKSGQLMAPLDLSGSDELASLARNFSQMLASLREFQRQRVEMETASALGEMARQVAHDIRSPLSALSVGVSMLDSLPEDQRTLLRQATQRIHDIATGLLSQGRAMSSHGPIPLVSLVDTLVSEKRAQIRGAVEIHADLGDGVLFATVPGAELTRALSNLLDNALEALRDGGRVAVSLAPAGEYALLELRDDGGGIPEEILRRLGERGITYGKAKGNGLGFYHAKKTVEAAGGTLAVESRVGRGTTVRIRLPRAEAPVWVATEVRVPPGAAVVSVDDEPTIHRLWAERLRPLIEADQVRHYSFLSVREFEAWLASRGSGPAVFLIDYEFSGQGRDGLGVIERNGLAKDALLVTWRFEEEEIRARAKIVGVKVLPKGLVPFVPVALL